MISIIIIFIELSEYVSSTYVNVSVSDGVLSLLKFLKLGVKL